MNENREFIGYLKYSGKSVEGGFLDARKSAEALLGFDEVLRYFISVGNPDFRNVNYEIPVRVKKGSWGIWIPIGIALTQYLNTIAKKAGSDGFFETGPSKDIEKMFRGAVIAAQWVMRIGIHVGDFAKKEFEKTVRIKQVGDDIIIGVPNAEGKILDVPKKYFDIYVKCPEKLFSKNANLIEQDRYLEMGVFQNSEEEKVLVTEKEKNIFYKKDDSDKDILFPELEHGQFVELDGEITRATESTNTIGFRYKDHTLVCTPDKDIAIAIFKNKMISQQKEHLFPRVKIRGIVSRVDKDGFFKERRPQIIFYDIESLEVEANNRKMTLF
ncbi:MAG: hypothetical protein PHT88_00205 [Candidatus Moranbacteria bacterium]|nr:hypothetical protein [Candidatus Moranbacteria bacterium]